MERKSDERRAFIKKGIAFSLGAIASTAAWGGVPDYADPFVDFVFPLDGDFLIASDGIETPGGLTIIVRVVPKKMQPLDLVINGQRAVFKQGVYEAPVVLSGVKNSISFKDRRTDRSLRITVFWLKDFVYYYRLSMDDTIFCLKDIHLNRDTYSSVFDSPFFAFLKELNNRFGTKTHLNLFYNTEGFNLSQMTDKFKAEWRQNASWLRFTIHAKAEFPDNPYISASYRKMKDDCDLINREIRRFAGEELLDRGTTLHWGEVPVQVSRALRDAGYLIQICDQNVDNDLPPCSYYLNVAQRRHINKRFIWRDNMEKIIFIKSAIIINTVPLDQINLVLDEHERKNHSKPLYLDLLNHEQYFFPFYYNYQPDYKERVIRSVIWACNKGYKPGFQTELFNNTVLNNI